MGILASGARGCVLKGSLKATKPTKAQWCSKVWCEEIVWCCDTVLCCEEEAVHCGTEHCVMLCWEEAVHCGIVHSVVLARNRTLL